MVRKACDILGVQDAHEAIANDVDLEMERLQNELDRNRRENEEKHASIFHRAVRRIRRALPPVTSR